MAVDPNDGSSITVNVQIQIVASSYTSLTCNTDYLQISIPSSGAYNLIFCL